MAQRLWGPLGLKEIFLPGFQEPAGPAARAWTGQGTALEVAPLGRMSLLSIGNSAFERYSNARTVARWGRAFFTGSAIGAEMRSQMLDFVPAAGNIPGESPANPEPAWPFGSTTTSTGRSGGTAAAPLSGAASCCTTTPARSSWW